MSGHANCVILGEAAPRASLGGSFKCLAMLIVLCWQLQSFLLGSSLHLQKNWLPAADTCHSLPSMLITTVYTNFAPMGPRFVG